MTYKSTRGASYGVSFSEAVLRGIAPDGGLYVPEQDVRFDSLELAEMCEMDYKTLAACIFSKYATDFSDEEIQYCVRCAYGKDSRFDAANPAPVVPLNKTLNVLELWHGPTAAFKDMALQVLPAFMSVALRKRQAAAAETGADGETGNGTGAQANANTDGSNRILILTATSGDTGKAALEGFRDTDGIDIMVFFPENGVSEVQKRQMVTQEGRNVRVVAVRGNFDDAQTGVKQIFADRAFAEQLRESGWQLSSANSINFGRLLPQIVYYFHAYFSLVRAEKISLGAKVNFVVPTGNFGDILAAYYAFKCGLPTGRLICAANSNNVVSDFLRTGFYDANRDFKVTISPAMDILISSNLERLIYDMSGEDEKLTGRLMAELKAHGCYNVDRSTLLGINGLFWSDYATEDETRAAIKDVWRNFKYLIDPHTAVGIDVYDKYVISTGDLTPTVAVSTASPFKFGRSVATAITQDPLSGINEFDILNKLSLAAGRKIPEPLRGLDARPILHTGVCDKTEMEERVSEYVSSRSRK